MRTPRSATLIKLLAVTALAGSLVGVESCEEALNPIPPTAEQILQYDNTTKTNVRNAVTIYEACYADTQNYVPCVATHDAELRALGVIPNGITSPGYSLTGTSKSGTSFTAKRDAFPPRGITFTCSVPGKGGCAADGTWLTAAASDAAAKSSLRNGITLVEACFSDTQSYASCVTKPELKALGVTGTSAGAGRFVLTIVSGSGNTFVATKSGGVVARTCTTAGVAGCPSTGTW